MSIVHMILIAWMVMAVIRTGLWLLQRSTGVGIVDVAWSFRTGLVRIPMTEERLRESRGDAYRVDERTTNRFFPGPPHTHETGVAS